MKKSKAQFSLVDDLKLWRIGICVKKKNLKNQKIQIFHIFYLRYAVMPSFVYDFYVCQWDVWLYREDDVHFDHPHWMYEMWENRRWVTVLKILPF